MSLAEDAFEARGAAWRILGASVRGASHLRSGSPNQDALLYRDGGLAVAALSDGHGAPRHARSDRGSRLAVEAATAVFGAAPAVPGTREEVLALGAETLRRWRLAVAADIARDPPAPGEPADAVSYGATLLVALLDGGRLALFQIGDGDIVLAGEGAAPRHALPADRGLVGEETYSICTEDALAHARAAVLPLGPAGEGADVVMMATDGLAKSFRSGEDFLRLASHWRTVLTGSGDGRTVLEAGLSDWLSSASRRGSGDDITLALARLVRPAPAPSGPGDLPFDADFAVGPAAAALSDQTPPAPAASPGPAPAAAPLVFEPDWSPAPAAASVFRPPGPDAEPAAAGQTAAPPPPPSGPLPERQAPPRGGRRSAAGGLLFLVLFAGFAFLLLALFGLSPVHLVCAPLPALCGDAGEGGAERMGAGAAPPAGPAAELPSAPTSPEPPVDAR